MARPRFNLLSDSEEDVRSSESSDQGTESTFDETMQKQMQRIRKRKQQPKKDSTDEECDEQEDINEDSEQSIAEESESEDEQTTKRFEMRPRKQQKRKTLQEEEDSDSDEQESKKRRKVQPLKSTKKQEGKKPKKGTKKQEGKKKEVQKAKIDWKQQKCTLSSFWRVINVHRERIPEATKAVLRGTHFWDMIEAFLEDKITEIQLHKHEVDLEIIMRHFDRTENKFKFGDFVTEITEEDITALFHLPAEGDVFNVNKRVVRDEMQDSTIFGSPLKKQAVLRTEVENKLITELTKPAKQKDARKIAVLMIAYLFSTFFFSRTGTQITWDMVAVCERIEAINTYNWPRLILDFLLEGLQKYKRNSPATMNGCLLLIYYWFLEKTKAKNYIPGKHKETPRFVRWSIKEIFNLEQLYKNENLAVDLIKDGPWSVDLGLDVPELDDEEQDTPSFDNWVPQASQAEEEQNERLAGNVKELISEMEAAMGEKNPTKEMEAKLRRLAEANEDLNAQTRDLLSKLKLADERIKALEEEKKTWAQERRAKNNLIRALYIWLGKEKGELPPQESEFQIVPLPSKVPQDEVEEAAPYFGASVGEEPHYTANVGHDTETVISACPLTMELPEQEEESREQPQQPEGGNQGEEEHLDCIVRMVAENEQKADIQRKKGAQTEHRKHAKTVEIHSIERNVKTYKRGAKKAKQEEWEYDTPEEAKMRKRAPPKRAANVLQTQKTVENKIKIKGVNCEKPTWRTLNPNVAKHLQDFFRVAEKDITEYWISSDLLCRITKHDLRVIIQEGDVETDVITVYIGLLKHDAEKLNAQVGFLNVEAAYCAINYELAKEKGEDTSRFECGVETMLIEPLWSVFHFKKVLVPIHHSTSMHYSLLVIDNERKCFTHMNSMRPPINDFTNEEKYHSNAARVVNNIKRFIHSVNLTKIRFPDDSQDPEVTREKCKGEDDKQNLIIIEEEMTEDEKETRNWILQNNIVETTYELYEDFDCPQQNTSSADCGPFMLHFMESIVNGHEPSKEGGDNMRKRMLQRIVNLVLGNK